MRLYLLRYLNSTGRLIDIFRHFANDDESPKENEEEIKKNGFYDVINDLLAPFNVFFALQYVGHTKSFSNKN